MGAAIPSLLLSTWACSFVIFQAASAQRIFACSCDQHNTVVIGTTSSASAETSLRLSDPREAVAYVAAHESYRRPGRKKLLALACEHIAHALPFFEGREKESEIMAYALKLFLLAPDLGASDQQALTNSTVNGTSFLLNTGLRIGEACAVQWDQVDLLRGAVQVCRNVDWISLISENTTKTHELRVVGIVPELMPILTNLHRRSFKPCIEKAKVKAITIHDLRHTGLVGFKPGPKAA